MARNTGLQITGDIASKIAILALYVVMARELGQDGFGDFTFAVSVVLFINLAGLGTDLVLTREVARDRAELHQLYWNINALKLSAGLLGLGIVVAIALLGDYDAEIRGTLGLVALASLLDLFAQTLQATFRGLEDFAPVAMSQVLQRLFTAITAGIALTALDADLIAVAALYLGGSLCALLYIAASLRRRRIRPTRSVSVARTRRVLAVSLPLGGAAAFGAILARIDIVILSLLESNAVVGLYAAAYRLFEGTLFLTWAFGTAVLPLFSRLDRSTSPTAAKALELGCKVGIGMLCPIAAAFVLFAVPLIEGLYGEPFADAASALRLLAIPTLLYGPFVLATLALAAQHREAVVGWLSAGGLAVNVGLNFALIPPYSLDGAAAAMAMSQIVLTAGAVGFAVRTVGRISAVRVLLGPLAGGAAMAATAFGLGTGGPQLLLALAAYPLALYGVERAAFPGDVRRLLAAVRRQQATA